MPTLKIMKDLKQLIFTPQGIEKQEQTNTKVSRRVKINEMRPKNNQQNENCFFFQKDIAHKVLFK